jgi:hypothetical protein
MTTLISRLQRISFSLCCIYATCTATATRTTSSISKTGMDDQDQQLPSFPLNPTVFLHPAHKTRSAPQQLHPHVGAVYAGLDYLSVPDAHDGDGDGDGRHLQHVNDHNDMIREFQERRQCSRFEHARRSMIEGMMSEFDRSLEDSEDEDEDYYDDDESTSNTKSMQGGAFNAYQTAPISQGIGTHYATLYIGSPMPQPQTLIVDTGSHHTAFPCKPCKKCGESYHTDEYFDTAQSHTYQKLTCGQCTEDVNNSCSGHGECAFSQAYAEGSSWNAYQAKDLVFCGYNHPKQIEIETIIDAEEDGRSPPYTDANPKHKYNLDKLDDQFALPFTFGCQTHLTGLFVTQLADGIMGMSASETTLPYQLWTAKKIEHNMFSMCFRRGGGTDKDGITAGVMTLGGVDKRLQRSPMVYAALNIRHGWYAVHVKKFWLRKGGGQSAKPNGIKEKAKYVLINGNEKSLNDGDGVIVDSGTTDTYFQRHLKEPFKKAFKEMTGMSFSNKKMTLTREEIMALPTILIQMAPHKDKEMDASVDVDDVVGLAGTGLSNHSPRDIILAIPATHYMEYSGEDDIYTPRIYFSESNGGVLGANAMMNHDVLFDWENNRVGFAESTCDYDELMESVEIADEGDLGDGASKDCVLGEASLVSTCVESVNTKDCMENNGDKQLIGANQWEMVVEEEGFGDGQDCESVTKMKFKDEKSTPVSPQCDGDGLCVALVKCSMTCQEAADELAANTEDDETSNSTTSDPETSGEKGSPVPCSNEGWGSCQSSCHQTKVVSKRRHDGLCHVHHVDKRKCHIDNCGRNDPCIVPFVVHVILLFADTESKLWNVDDEEQLVESFASTVNMEREEGDELFGPGDAQILSVGPWKADEFYEGSVKTGMQVMLEVSIYNDKAVLPLPGTKDKVKNFVTGPDHATCNDSDIYRLSQNALDVHLEMGKAEFMRLLIGVIRDSAGHNSLISRNSVFASISDEGESVDNSKVLTSWTIKTEVNSLFDGGFDALNKDTWKNNIPLEIAIFLFLLLVCCFGSCCGTFFTNRRYRLTEAKNALMQRAEKMRQEKERGQYATIDGGTQMDDTEGEIELGDIERFDDNPIENVEELEFDDDVGDKMNRLNML